MDKVKTKRDEDTDVYKPKDRVTGNTFKKKEGMSYEKLIALYPYMMKAACIRITCETKSISLNIKVCDDLKTVVRTSLAKPTWAAISRIILRKFLGQSLHLSALNVKKIECQEKGGKKMNLEGKLIGTTEGEYSIALKKEGENPPFYDTITLVLSDELQKIYEKNNNAPRHF